MIRSIIAAALLSVTLCAHSRNPARELEPNDTPSTANYIEIAAGDVKGRLADVNDVDAFNFRSPAGGSVITFTIGVAPDANSNAALLVGVYRDPGAPAALILLGGYEVPAGLSVTFPLTAPEGVYHVVLSKRDNHPVPAGDYTVRSTWNVVQAPVCPLDLDGNGKVDALTDGIMSMRILFGLTGDSVTNGAIGAGATRTTFDQIKTFLNTSCGTTVIP